jgi:hypothetical protein
MSAAGPHPPLTGEPAQSLERLRALGCTEAVMMAYGFTLDFLAGPRQHPREGVRSLDVSCWICHHRAILSADRRPDDVRVPDGRPADGLHPLRDHRGRCAAEVA